MAIKSQPYTLLDNKEFRGTQSRNLPHILKPATEHKPRISIKRNSYDFQSSAKIELWSKTDGKWNFMPSIPFAEVACVKSALEGKMEEDVRELLQTALLIII